MSNKMEWEKISFDSRRMKVVGGWVFNTWSANDDNDITSEACCFIPDPEHIWKAEKHKDRNQY